MEIDKASHVQSRLRGGESLFLRKENIVVTIWKDEKPVYFLSSQSDPVGGKKIEKVVALSHVVLCGRFHC